MSEWSVAEPRRLTFDEPVTALHVRVVNGTVNVVGTDEGSTRLEVSDLEGPPLTVTQKDGTLTVAYDDLPWKGFLKWLDRKGWRRNVLVSLAVPASTRVEVSVVGAAAVVSGMDGHTEVKGVSGDTTLVGLAGHVRATTVSGSVEAQSVTGDLRLGSVSGDLTVIEGSCPTVKADSVSGSIILDLDPTGGPTDVGLTSVSGEIAIRLPHPTDTEVEANTASGTISNAFDDLRVSGPWGAHKVTGRLGSGTGRLKATTLSGSIALLRRPPREDEPWDEKPKERRHGRAEPSTDGSTPEGSGSGSGSGLGDDAPAGGTPGPGDGTPESGTPGPGEGTTESGGPEAGSGAADQSDAASHATAADASDGPSDGASDGTPATEEPSAVTDNSSAGSPLLSDEPPGQAAHSAAEEAGGASPDESFSGSADGTTSRTTDKKVL